MEKIIVNLLRTKKFIESSNGEAKVDSRNKYGSNSIIGSALFYTIKSAFALVILTSAYYGISVMANTSYDSGNTIAESVFQNTNLEIQKPREERKKSLEDIQIKVLDVKFLPINDTQDYVAIGKLLNILNKDAKNNFSKFNDSIITARNSLILAADADNYDVKFKVFEDLMTIMDEDQSIKKAGYITPELLLNKYKKMQQGKKIENSPQVPDTTNLFEKIKGKTVETTQNIVNTVKNKI